MVKQVKVTTPIPSLEDFGESLGLTKTRRNSLAQIILGKGVLANAARRHANIREASLSTKTVAAARN